MGMRLGREAGYKVGHAEAMKMFKIGISKERVMSLKKHFGDLGKAEGRMEVVYKSAVVQAVVVAKEEASKFCHEEGAKAGAAAARKLLAAEGKKLANEGGEIGEVSKGYLMALLTRKGTLLRKTLNHRPGGFHC